MITARRVALVVVILALVFALQGGEYGVTDLLELRRQVADEQERIAALGQEVDSLDTRLRLLQRDPAAQERQAREEFGMIRDGEFLFRLVPARSPRSD